MNNIIASSLITATTVFASFAPTLALANYQVQVPDNLKVSNQQVMLFDIYAEGVQIYTCKSKKNVANQYEWVLKAPEAILLSSKDKTPLGKHYAGPTWEAKDGSKVVGEVKSRADAPSKNTIPWLLLSAKLHAGNGVFSKVNYIQRVNTSGGKAPASGCDANNVNAEARVNYTASYYFYGSGR